jgi:hypothetical protein
MPVWNITQESYEILVNLQLLISSEKSCLATQKETMDIVTKVVKDNRDKILKEVKEKTG